MPDDVFPPAYFLDHRLDSRRDLGLGPLERLLEFGDDGLAAGHEVRFGFIADGEFGVAEGFDQVGNRVLQEGNRQKHDRNHGSTRNRSPKIVRAAASGSSKFPETTAS